MATDPRHNVRPGDKLRIAAEQINWINRQMRAETGFKAGPLEGYEPGRNIILARNNTGADLPRWGVMRISGIEVDPAADDKGRRSFEEMPCVTGSKPNAATGGKFVIAVEPIKDGKIGRVCAAGIVQAKVSFSDAGHTRAKPKDDTVEHLESAAGGPAEILWSAGTSGEQWALVRFGEGGQLRIGKYTGSSTWAKHTTATIDIWENGTPPNETSSSQTIENVVNHWAAVPSGKWVGVQLGANGHYYLVVAEC
jgi:hypothetical protein